MIIAPHPDAGFMTTRSKGRGQRTAPCPATQNGNRAVIPVVIPDVVPAVFIGFRIGQ